MLFGGWAILCLLAGHSFTSIVFILVGMFWILPKIWDNFIAKSLDNNSVKLLMFIAVLCIICAIYCLL